MRMSLANRTIRGARRRQVRPQFAPEVRADRRVAPPCPAGQRGPEDVRDAVRRRSERTAGPTDHAVGVPPDRPVAPRLNMLRAGRVTDMPYDRGRFEADRPPLPTRPPAPVEILGVHEQPFVETADVIERCTPHEERGANSPVDLAARVVVPRAVQHEVPGAPRMAFGVVR